MSGMMHNFVRLPKDPVIHDEDPCIPFSYQYPYERNSLPLESIQVALRAFDAEWNFDQELEVTKAYMDWIEHHKKARKHLIKN